MGGIAINTIRKLYEVAYLGKGNVHVKFKLNLHYYIDGSRVKIENFKIDSRFPVNVKHTQHYTLTIEEMVNMKVDWREGAKKLRTEMITGFLLTGSFGRKGKSKAIVSDVEKKQLQAVKDLFSGKVEFKEAIPPFKSLLSKTVPSSKTLTADFSKQLNEQIINFEKREALAHQEALKEKTQEK